MWPPAWSGRSPAANASSGRARAENGWRTGRWFRSCGPSGRGPAPTISSAARSRALTYTPEDADGLTLLEAAPRTVRGARDLLSVALQYGNAFGRGFQAAALKPADFFGNDDVLYLMEDMATGEIRMSILWEWLHKSARFTDDDPETGVAAGDAFSTELFGRLLEEEYAKLQWASNRDVHDDSKPTTLPIARAIVEAYVHERRQAALVHRLAQPQPRQPRPRDGEPTHRELPRRVPAGRHAPDREPGFLRLVS